MDRAIYQDHNSLLATKIMVKYGDAEDKARAQSMLRDFTNWGMENKLADTSPTESVPIPFTIPSSRPILDYQDTGDEIGFDALTWGQRECKRVYESTECLDSSNRFSPTDVFL